MIDYLLYNNLPVGIFVIDFNYTILFWNKMMENFTGKTSEEMLNKNLLKIYPHLDKKMYRFRLEQIFLGGPPAIFSSQLHKYIVPCKLLNGQYRQQHSTVSGIKSKTGQGFNAVFSIQDITDESKRIEEYKKMRIQALDEIEKRKMIEEELRESNATKAKFFSIISHDLKNPFFTLLGFSEIILTDFKQLSQEELQTYLSEIYKVSKNTFNLLEDLLLWSNSQKDKLTLRKEKFTLIECANQAISTLTNIAEQKSIEIENLIQENISVFADKDSIRTVIRNLISNAIKFTNKGGSISLSSKQQNGEIIVTVSDTGVGISEKRLNEIFQIGIHTSTNGTNNEQGTGLGLVLCHDFIEKHKGRIWVESELGKGSKFNFSLPT